MSYEEKFHNSLKHFSHVKGYYDQNPQKFYFASAVGVGLTSSISLIARFSGSGAALPKPVKLFTFAAVTISNLITLNMSKASKSEFEKVVEKGKDILFHSIKAITEALTGSGEFLMNTINEHTDSTNKISAELDEVQKTINSIKTAGNPSPEETITE